MKILTFAEYSLNREITQGGAALMRRPLEAMQNRMWLCGAHEWRQKATNLCIGKALTSPFSNAACFHTTSLTLSAGIS